MTLNSVKTTECPNCGCNIVISESVKTDYSGKIWTHISGERQECRQFLCGYEVVYSPNLLIDEETRRCHKSKKAVIVKEVNDLFNKITTLDLRWGYDGRTIKTLAAIKKELKKMIPFVDKIEEIIEEDNKNHERNKRF